MRAEKSYKPLDKATPGLWPEIKRYAGSLPGADAKKVALVGAGFYGRAAYHCLKAEDITVTCFVDNNPQKHNETYEGIPVISVETLAKRRPTIALVTARHALQPIAGQLDALGIANVSFDGFFITKHLERLQRVRSSLADERSVHVFDSLLLSMATGDLSHCRAVAEGNQYFALTEFVNNGGGHFVDVGAYVGDTAEQFIWMNNGVFNKIYAFEPGPKQFAALTRRMKRLAAEWAFDDNAYECIQAGLGEKKEKKTINDCSLIATTLGDANDQGSFASVMPLDFYFKNKPVSFIKADIEGMELAMLKGARQVIARDKPRLAISVYHRPDDLFVIPEYIKSIVPQYRMALRHHSPLLMDFILYCWMENA